MTEAYGIIDSWLYQTLSGDSALVALVGGRIGSELSAETWAGPFVTWNVPSTRMIRSISGEILDSDSICTVTARTRSNSYASADAIASRVRAVLDNRNVTLPGASLTCFMENSVRLAETVEGVAYRHISGLFRVRAVSL